MQKSTLVAMLIAIMHDSFITAEELQDRDLLNRQMIGRQREDRQMVERQMMERKDRQLLERICKKCSYCDTDPGCEGCARCGQCSSRAEVMKYDEMTLVYDDTLTTLSLQEGCRFCKAGEGEAGCRERCNRGCRICRGKDGQGLKSCGAIVE